MSIDFNCASCGRNYKVAESNAGKRFACKQCGKPVEVPAGGAVAAPAPLAAPAAAGAVPGRGPRLPGGAGPRPMPGRPMPGGGPRPVGPRAPGAPRPYGHQPMHPGQMKTSGMAIASMVLFGVGCVCGLLMFAVGVFFFIAALCGLVGLILGIVGLVQTKKGGRYKGFGLALAGTILNGLALLSVIALFLLVIAVIAAAANDPGFQRQMQQQQGNPRGYEAPIHRMADAPAHRAPEWALLP